MRNRMIAVVAAMVTAALAAGASAHPIHESLAEVEFNAKTGRLEVALRVFADDLEAAISRRERRDVKLEQTPNVDVMIVSYLTETFKVRPAGVIRGAAPVWIDWVGKEVAPDETWLYFEIVLPGPLRGARIGQHVFFEQFDDQVNTVQIRDGAWQATKQITRDDPWLVVPAVTEGATQIGAAAAGTPRQIRPSPNGQHALVEIETTGAGGFGGGAELVVVSVADGRQTPITGAGGVSEVRWSPNGSLIVFRREGRLFRVNADGSHETPLMIDALQAASFAWSADSQRVATVLRSPRGGPGIDPSATEWGLYVIDVTRGAGVPPRRLGDVRAQPEADVTWLADGRHVVTQRFVGSDEQGGEDLVAVEVDGGAVTPLATTAVRNPQPCAASHGDQVAFVARNDERGTYEVRVVDVSGGSMQTLRDGLRAEPKLLGWTGNRAAVILVDPSPPGARIGAIDINGGAVNWIAPLYVPIDDASLSASGMHMGFLCRRAGGKPQAFLATTSGGIGGWQVKKVYPAGW